MASEVRKLSLKGRIYHIRGHDHSNISAGQVLDHQEIYHYKNTDQISCPNVWRIML